MNKVDIFEVAKEKVMPTWAKFTAAGDSFQGTYVGALMNQTSPAYPTTLQHVYQLLQEDGSILNVAFGINKKVLHKDMEAVKFGQIIGFKYKGTITVKNRNSGQMVNVKDYSLHQDPKIVNEKWLEENKNNLPVVVQGNNENSATENLADEFPDEEDVPFSSEGSLTNEDKLTAIKKMAKEKLGIVDDVEIKGKVMESTGIAFIPVNYDKISAALAAM